MKRTSYPRGERCYIFRSFWMRLGVRIMDLAGAILVGLFTGGKGLRPDLKVMANPARILVIRLDHIGDILFARPCFQALRALYPQARITALVSRAGASLLNQDTSIDETIIWEAPWFKRSDSSSGQLSFWGLARELRSCNFDLSLDLRGDLRHHILLMLAKITVRVGYGITGGAFLLHVPLKLRIGVHEVERNLDAVRALGAGETPQTFSPLALNADELQRGQKLWHSAGYKVVMHPGSGDPAKCWPSAAFAEVCDALTEHGCEIVLVGTAAEKSLAENVAGLCHRPVRVLAGETSLRGLGALTAAADLFIGNDSGPAHLAVTQGIPVIIIWSETNTPEEWGPWGENVRFTVIRQPEQAAAVGETIQAAKRWLNI